MARAAVNIRIWLSKVLGGRDDRGASLVEYALLLVLILVVCVIAIGVLGEEVDSSYSEVGSGFG